MLFAISPGTDGSDGERYVLYLPFTLAPGANLSALADPMVCSVADYRVTLEKLQSRYAISLGAFESKDDAAVYASKLRASLLWFSLESNCGVSYPKKLSEWSATDGYYDADKAVIRPENKRLLRWEGGQPSVILGISAENFFASIQQAWSFPTLERVIEADKLKLAIEIYAAYRFEMSENAQFITLVTALEALLPKFKVSEHSAAALQSAKDVVEKAQNEYSKDSDEWNDLKRLLSRVQGLEYESIGRTIDRFISELVSSHLELESAAQPIERKALYDVRSALLHGRRPLKEGEVNQHLILLREFMPLLLKALFRKAAGAVPQPSATAVTAL